MLTGTRRPARTANLARNLLADPGRQGRWRSVRDALWSVLDRHVGDGARVAVVGAGNADDVPLTRLLARAGAVDLIDLARRPSSRALRREPREFRDRARVRRRDVTGGAADRIAVAALRGRAPRLGGVSSQPLGVYDVVVGDLLYTQLLYPALLDARLPQPRIGAVLAAHGQSLCDAVVARLHASAPEGVVVHVNDIRGWWPGHRPERPTGCDIDLAIARIGARPLERTTWMWPFDDRTDYLVEAIVALSMPHREPQQRRPAVPPTAGVAATLSESSPAL